MTVYVTVDGDTLDYIVWRHYGKTSGVLEQVLEQNRHLRQYDAVLPAGVQITLPIIPEKNQKQKIKIWQ